MHHEAVLPIKAAHLSVKTNLSNLKYISNTVVYVHAAHHVTADVSLPGSYRVPSCRRVRRLPVLFSGTGSE